MRDRIQVDETGTRFLRDGLPQFGRQFLRAMSFHWPEGLAAVQDDTGAYHIGTDGQPAYARRFREAFGFYEGLATVRDVRGWFHVHPDGRAVHEHRFRWAGNHQGGRCAVLGHDGFFHVRPDGSAAYGERYRYAGDFRGGLAVVHGAAGAFHIRPDGERLSAHSWEQAGPFHKGYAAVADADGWFHVDRSGQPVHALRLANAEPFYNGVALCTTLEGDLIRVRECGTWTRIADTVAPIGLAEVRAALGAGTRVGLVLRHAERHPITPESPNWGNGVLLTERGHRQGEALGQRLQGLGSLGLWSSPVERCRQTALAVAHGAQAPDPSVRTHTHLGHPGIYLDGTGHHEALMQADFHAYATGYLDQGIAPGSRPVPEASEELLAWVVGEMGSASCTLFITHDFFSAALMSYLGLKAPDRDDWCDYLEGVCVLDGPQGVQLRRFFGLSEC